MKYLSFLIITAVITAMMIISCDKVEEPLVLVNEQDIPQDLDTNYYVDSVIVTEKHVLLEDFTGHKCVNCAEAAITAHEWAEDNGHKLIIYGVHSGYYATPDETGLYTMDFTCEVGDEIFNSYSITGWPAATVDRVEYNGHEILSFETGEWEAVVNQELAKESVIDMTLKNYYFYEDNELLVEVSSTFLQQLDDKYYLVVLIAEDHIIAPQKNNEPSIGPSPDWEDYEHRNVLRDGLSGAFGEYITAGGAIVQGETYTTQFYYELNEDWVTENCNIIAYIYEETSGDILQVAELGIKTVE